MEIIEGDLTECKGVIIHQVNDIGKMGSGVAKTIREKFPQHYADYMKQKDERGLLLGDLVVTKLNDIVIIGMISQKGVKWLGNQTPISYTAFETCLAKINRLHHRNPNVNFYMPYGIGCVRGGGDWYRVYEMIERLCPFITLVKYNGEVNK